MNLLIHDLNENEWSRVADKYKGWEIISDNGTIKPCAGCFGCWFRNPGQCVIKDGYNRMGELIHKADEIVVISRYTYGGFSSFVKNVFDRGISWMLPYFEIYEGEMHHKKRYPEDKTISFIFRAESFTADEKEKAGTYVEAVCRNFRGKLKDLIFEQCAPSAISPREEGQDGRFDPQKTVLLNGSLRGDGSNSRKFLTVLAGKLEGEPEIVNLSAARQDELAETLLSAGTVVLGMPLYVDGIPSQVLRIMEKMAERPGNRKKVYVVANMGFYESRQIRNLLSMVKDWCDRCGYDYCGGLAVGAGEMMGRIMAPKGPAQNVMNGMDRLAAAVNTSAKTEDIYADAHWFPRFLYILAAHMGWSKAAKMNGLKKKDLYRRWE